MKTFHITGCVIIEANTREEAVAKIEVARKSTNGEIAQALLDTAEVDEA